jgi:hypothetical protein
MRTPLIIPVCAAAFAMMVEGCGTMVRVRCPHCRGAVCPSRSRSYLEVSQCLTACSRPVCNPE